MIRSWPPRELGDFLNEIITDPLAPIRQLIESVANMSRYLEIDPTYRAIPVHPSNYEVYNKEGAHSENLIVLL